MKKELRKEIGRQLVHLSNEERHKESIAVIAQIKNSSFWQQSESILGFYPFRNEINLVPLWEMALQQKKKIYLPRMHKKNMDFLRCRDLLQLEKNSLGISEPMNDSEIWKGDAKGHSLMLLPGLLFHSSGQRLGWGGGYYDRWLNKHRNSTMIPEILAGVGYSLQISPEPLPSDPWDIGVNILFTPSRIIPCN